MCLLFIFMYLYGVNVEMGFSRGLTAIPTSYNCIVTLSLILSKQRNKQKSLSLKHNKKVHDYF